MELPALLTAVAAGIPLISALMLWMDGSGIAERHHSHHDTYVIAGTLTWTLVFAMIFMGALGVLLGWLCIVGVFGASPAVVLGFFDAFLAVSFGYWLLLRRYKVITYDDHMEITPFFGRKASIVYDEITSMKWAPSLLMPSGRNVYVLVGQHRGALLWSGLDLDQILIRIDRFDALEDTSASRR